MAFKKRHNELNRTSADKKTMDKLVQQFLAERKSPVTAQQTMPFEYMDEEGVCKLPGKRYNFTVEFDDVFYQLGSKETQESIFKDYCSLLNYMNEDMDFQFTFLTQKIDMMELHRRVAIRRPEIDDGHNWLRDDYQLYINSLLAMGKNNYIRRKVLTCGIQADSDKEASDKLRRIRREVVSYLKKIGCMCWILTGEERAELLFRCMNRNRPFAHTWSSMEHNHLNAKDVIVPEMFEFTPNSVRMGKQIAASSTISITAEQLSDRFLTDILAQDNCMMVSIHGKAYSQNSALKLVKRTISELQRSMILEQQKAVKNGYDYTNVPTELNAKIENSKQLYELVSAYNQRLFEATIVVCNISDNPPLLGTEIATTTATVRKHNCTMRPLDNRQENGLISALPLGYNQIAETRTLSTQALGILLPFTSEELCQLDEGACCYGVNPLSGRLIRLSREKLRNSNGIVLGTPGSGKSYFCKKEILDRFLNTDFDFLIIDPEAEYIELTRNLGGSIIDVSPASRDYINMMDIDLSPTEEDPLNLKLNFLLSVIEQMIRRPSGLEAGERTIISRCMPMVYKDYFANPIPQNMPILGDLYEAFLQQPEEESKRLAQALELYVSGQWNFLNHHTNVELGRMVNFNIKELQANILPLGMLITEEITWQRVKQNRSVGKRTYVYHDEFHLLLRDNQTAAYFTEIYKRFRKWGATPTSATQNAKSFLNSREIENILDNSDFVVLFNQAAGDLKELSARLHISENLQTYAQNVQPGQGILIYDKCKLAFEDSYPNTLQSYYMMSTKPEDVKRYKQMLAKRQQEANYLQPYQENRVVG